MIVITYLLLLTLSPIGLLALSRYRPDFKFNWLLSAVLLGGFLSVVVLLNFPQEFLPLLNWGIEGVLSVELVFILDEASLSLLIALAGLSFSAILFEANSALQKGWQEWAGILGVLGFTGFTIAAGSPLTMLLTWSAVDVFEGVLLLRRSTFPTPRTSGLNAIAVRMVGTLLLLTPVVALNDLGSPLAFENLTPQIFLIYVIAAMLRFWSIAPDNIDRSGTAVLLQFAPVLTGTTLLVRAAGEAVPFDAGLLENSIPVVFLVMIMLLASLGWFAANKPRIRRTTWVIALGTSILLGGLFGDVATVLGGSLILVLGGGLFFLGQGKIPRLVLMSAVLVMLPVPFFPGYSSILIQSQFSSVVGIVLIAAYALIFGGYALHLFGDLSKTDQVVVGLRVLYMLGFIVLVGGMAYIWLTFQPENPPSLSPDVLRISVQIVTIALVILWGARGGSVPESYANILSQVIDSWLAFAWGRRIIFRINRVLGVLIDFFSRLMEGEGGIVWSMILLVMLLTLLSGAFQGGG